MNLQPGIIHEGKPERRKKERRMGTTDTRGIPTFWFWAVLVFALVVGLGLYLGPDQEDRVTDRSANSYGWQER